MNINLVHYDQHLSRSCKNLPTDAARPQPSSLWPEENRQLYEKYRTWLLEGGGGVSSVGNVYMPIAGHILGLNTVSFRQMDLEKDFEKVLEFARARESSEGRLRFVNLAILRFRKFVRIELGLGEAPKFKPFDQEHYTHGLPPWLSLELESYQRSQQRNWRPVRVMANLQSFWSKHGKMWRYFCEIQVVQEFGDLKRAHILAFIDHLLDEKYSSNTVNCNILTLRGFLHFLQTEGYSVPHALLRVKTLQTPDNLPKYLRDEQVIRLRDALRVRSLEAERASQRRQALLDQAIFYLLWHGGLRVGEVEELQLEDLDLPARRLSIRDGKGRKDRTVYLTDVAVKSLREYLQVRGVGMTEHVFLYRNAALNKSFIGSFLKTLGDKVDVKVYAHRLRHTAATQLLNAGCSITSIQRILGHKNIRTTLIYAKAYDQTVADDFYAAMARVEARLSLIPAGEPAPDTAPLCPEDEVVKVPTIKIMNWMELLSRPELGREERLEIAESLRQALGAAALAAAPPG